MQNPTQIPNTSDEQSPYIRRTAAQAKQRQRRLAGPLILLACLLMAVLVVVFVPLLVSGTEAASSRPASAGTNALPQTGQSYATPEQALAALDFAPQLPTALPEGYTLGALQVLEGNILEITYQNDKSTVYFRAAVGNQDLSADDTDYAYAMAEEAAGVTRSCRGTGENALYTAVWTEGGASYALCAPGGVPAEVLRGFV